MEAYCRRPPPQTTENEAMNGKFSMLRRTALLLAAAIALPVMAQDQVDPFGPKVMEEVIVTAPRILRRETIDRSIGGGTVEQVTLTRRVSYADLDLKKPADVDELGRRVDAMAHEACQLLVDIKPVADAEPSESECIRRAIAGAKTQVDAAVTAANQ